MLGGGLLRQGAGPRGLGSPLGHHGVAAGLHRPQALQLCGQLRHPARTRRPGVRLGAPAGPAALLLRGQLGAQPPELARIRRGVRCGGRQPALRLGREACACASSAVRAYTAPLSRVYCRLDSASSDSVPPAPRRA